MATPALYHPDGSRPGRQLEASLTQRAVLHLLPSAATGATAQARMVESLLDATPPNWTAHVWFLGPDGPLAHAMAQRGARVRSIGWSGSWSDPAGAWRYVRALRQMRFDLVHVHAGGRSPLFLARRTTHAAIVAHIHSYLGSEGPGAAARTARVHDAHMVIANSQATARHLSGAPLRVVYPGVRPTAPATHPDLRPDAPLVIGAVSRLVPIKGISVLLHAVRLTQRTLPGLRLEIAGSGPQRQSLEQLAKQLGIVRQVHFLGWREDISILARDWSIFVQPSLHEGFGMAALEAMAAGLPVVASATGGLSELVSNGQTGRLVPPGDSHALAAAIMALASDPALRARMGHAARARAESLFSGARMAAEVFGLYDELLDGRRTH
jgi:glycosyltransferase involved in cell wall biosynthesis